MHKKNPINSFLVCVILILTFVSANIVNRHVGGDPFREGKMILFLFTAMVAGCVWVANRFDPWIAVVIGIASAEWAWASGPVYGIMPTAGVLAFLYLGHVCSQNVWATHLVLRSTTWLQVVFCTLQIFHIQTFGSNDPYFYDLITGNMGHPSVVGAWFAAVAPLAWFYWSRFEFVLFAALALWSGSTMAIIGLLAGGGYTAFRLMPKPRVTVLSLLAIPGVMILILGVCFLPQVEFFSLSGRMLPWKAAYEWILKSPVVGYGPGSWDGLYQQWGVQYFKRWNFLHNDWLQLAHEVGIPALLLSLAAAYSVLRKSLVPYGACMAALLVNAVGNFTFHLPPIAFLFVVALGLGVRDNGPGGIKCVTSKGRDQ